MSINPMGERLESERNRLGLNAVSVYEAPEVNIAQTTYKNYEAGRRDIPSTLLAKLWDMGFDVMYVLTGQRLEDIAVDVLNNDEGAGLPLYHQRLIDLPEDMDINNPADALLVAMYHAEEAMIQAGARANNDYDYQYLGTIGLGLMDKVK